MMGSGHCFQCKNPFVSCANPACGCHESTRPVLTVEDVILARMLAVYAADPVGSRDDVIDELTDLHWSTASIAEGLSIDRRTVLRRQQERLREDAA